MGWGGGKRGEWNGHRQGQAMRVDVVHACATVLS